jgi:hypothetical protein
MRVRTVSMRLRWTWSREIFSLVGRAGLTNRYVRWVPMCALAVALPYLSGCTSHSSSSVERTVPAPVMAEGVHCNTDPASDHEVPAEPPAQALRDLGHVAALRVRSQAVAFVDEPMDNRPVQRRIRMRQSDYDTLAAQLRQAATASCRLRTVHAVQDAGYFLSSPYVDGIGTHWINWKRVDRPFDPARPSMLLFANIEGRERLVGFSYWVRSTTEPVGFAGALDRWHRHKGLCFAHGTWAGTDMPRRACRGVWLNGLDLWMLHAWIVPGTENPAGVFAPANRSLCRVRTVDVGECPRNVRSVDVPPTLVITDT